MFDFLRNLPKSAAEKQQEALNAYLDDALSPRERQQFEQMLAGDADLRQELEMRRALQMQMRQMPRRRVPRNFTLDPAVYGRPQRQPLFQLYPAMRVAAVMTAIFFILAVGADLFSYGRGATTLSAPQDVAMVEETVAESAEEPMAETAVAAPFAAQAVEVTRVVTEEVVEGEMAAEAAPLAEDTNVTEEMAAEEEMPAAAEEPAAEEMLTADAVEDEGGPPEAPGAAAPLPTPSPAPTQTAPTDVDATKSTVPRPEAEATAVERALTAAATTVPEAANGAAQTEVTAVPSSRPIREPISGLRWLQIGLGVLLVVLVTAVFYVRRQTF